MNAQDLIIGSGPSAYAAACALVAKGRDVLILDAGLAMDGAAEALRSRMGSTEPDQWSAEDRIAIAAVRRSDRSDSIMPFGSDFLFRLPEEVIDLADSGGVHNLRPSFARGGLSNGWGASVLPYHSSDFEGWPINLDDLAPHYQAVAPMIGLAAVRDGLADFYSGLAVKNERALPQSGQARELLKRMENAQGPLAKLNLYFGASRQAIAPGCHACAMCLYGCPYRLIFNAGDQVARMAAEGQLRYQGGLVVRGFEEDANGVCVETDKGTFCGDRLFIGGGVIPTAKLVLGSLGLTEEVRILDSQHFYLPMLHRWNGGSSSRDPHHTLAQVFWAMNDHQIHDHVVHTQIYTYNDTYAPDMRHRFGPLAGLAKPLIDILSRRLIVAQAFLHSDASPAFGARLQDGKLAYRRIENASTGTTVLKVRDRLAKVARLSGLMPLKRLLRLGSLGSSFHCGGSFPMRANPKPGETDVLGRPSGHKRTHIIDASIFPTIPAPTITFSVMANAHRIAQDA
ncbi:GMC oxidoreductase [Aquisediminimonas profunda]|uniref:GMC oxidoreductase n=1 Tax=Aquisediminimonas profunda TaxID=1550733 RepID=UPI001C629CBB|nr:GMC oxidoreductase [Aquisediminimonas profunda]